VQTFEITIKARSAFATPIKGDTFFGHICWQAAYDNSLFGAPIKDLLAEYEKSPFIVVSSAYPKIYDSDRELYALKKPDLPLEMLFDLTGMDKAEIIRQRKVLKKKRWMIVEKSAGIKDLMGLEFINDEELYQEVSKEFTDDTKKEFMFATKSFVVEFAQPHNTINRLTGTTGEGMFAPYSTTLEFFVPEAELAVFVGVNTAISIDSVEEALKRIGELGFGKDASTGLGRFDVCDVSEINFREIGHSSPNVCYTLSPSVPGKGEYRDMYFTPFVRFGRHGDKLAKSSNPFKNPVIMADEGAVFYPKDSKLFGKPYIGSAVKGISKTLPEAVSQGYALYIPLKVEGIP